MSVCDREREGGSVSVYDDGGTVSDSGLAVEGPRIMCVCVYVNVCVHACVFKCVCVYV